MSWTKLFDEPPLKRVARQFAASIQMHALVELGFEDHMNTYEPREVALIGSQCNGPGRERLYAHALESAQGEERELLEATL